MLQVLPTIRLIFQHCTSQCGAMMSSQNAHLHPSNELRLFVQLPCLRELLCSALLQPSIHSHDTACRMCSGSSQACQEVIGIDLGTTNSCVAVMEGAVRMTLQTLACCCLSAISSCCKWALQVVTSGSVNVSLCISTSHACCT